MHYTQLFRSLREAKGLTIDELARLARRHRNTVVNVETGRPVKFKTIAELMVKMGHAPASPEMKGIALLWLEAVSGISFSKPQTELSAQRVIGRYRAVARQLAGRLEETVIDAGLNESQIALLSFVARHPGMLDILQTLRDVAEQLAAEKDAPALKVAEDQ